MAESLICNDMGMDLHPIGDICLVLTALLVRLPGGLLTNSTAAQPALVPHGALSEPRASCAAELHSSLQAILQS